MNTRKKQPKSNHRVGIKGDRLPKALTPPKSLVHIRRMHRRGEQAALARTPARVQVDGRRLCSLAFDIASTSFWLAFYDGAGAGELAADKIWAVISELDRAADVLEEMLYGRAQS